MLSADMRYYELLKRSYPKIKEKSHEIGLKTYENMFAESDEIKQLFKDTPPSQAQRLVDTIIFFCEGVDNFNTIYEKLDKIAHIHIKYGVKNDYYEIMKKSLSQALCETFQVDKNDELIKTWMYGFALLSQELIHIENLIRKYSEAHNYPEPYSEYTDF